ncbi:hypothetical protein [Flavobacterium sp.]
MENSNTNENFETLDTNLNNIININNDTEIFEDYDLDSDEIFYILQSSL